LLSFAEEGSHRQAAPVQRLHAITLRAPVPHTTRHRAGLQASSTYTYILACPETGDAVIIDPVLEHAKRDATLVNELGLHLRYALNTHVHADHITGTAALRKLLASSGGAPVQSVLAAASKGKADVLVADGDVIKFGTRSLRVLKTSGHTNGCISFVLDDSSMAFTGDALFVRGCGRTDFQEGSAADLYDNISAKVFTLPEECLLYPGHDYTGRTVTTVAEEKRCVALQGCCAAGLLLGCPAGSWLINLQPLVSHSSDVMTACCIRLPYNRINYLLLFLIPCLQVQPAPVQGPRRFHQDHGRAGARAPEDAGHRPPRQPRRRRGRLASRRGSACGSSRSGMLCRGRCGCAGGRRRRPPRIVKGSIISMKTETDCMRCISGRCVRFCGASYYQRAACSACATRAVATPLSVSGATTPAVVSSLLHDGLTTLPPTGIHAVTNHPARGRLRLRAI